MIGAKHPQILALSLVFITILFFNLYERYVPISAELLDNTEFNLPLSKWNYSNIDTINSSNGIIRLHSDNYSTDAYITQLLPIKKHNKLLRLSADTKTSQVSRNQKYWMSARIILLSHRQNGTPIYGAPHNLVNLHGDSSWSHSSRVFKIPETADKIGISAQLANVTGTFWIRNISLQAVSEKTSFQVIRIILIGLWLAMALYIAPVIIRALTANKYYQIALILGMVITIGVMLPASIRDELELFLLNTKTANQPSVMSIFSFQLLPISLPLNIYKTGHFILFFLITLTMYNGKPKYLSNLYIFYNILVFALMTEALQLFITGRNPGIRDLLIDTGGIIFGLLIYLIKQFLFDRSENQN